ncbi:MAG: aldehyde dehydrogenase family protein [Pseudorhodoplanes sp.]
MQSEIRTVLDQDFKMLVGGKLADASDGATLETRNPANGAFLASVPNASPADVERAIAAARKAWPAWRELGFRARREIVLKMGAILRQHTETFGILDTLDTGNILKAMRADAVSGADLIDYYASLGFELKGETTHLDDNLHYTRREPYGVVLRLLPFNHPIASAGQALAAPLVTGNCVILKPSPHTPLSTLALARLIKDVVPPGVITVMTGDNDRVSVPLIQHPGVDRISLIGSVEAGKAVMRMASDRLVPLTLELGGKNPLIVFPDFDVDQAVEIAVASMSFGWQSHSCGSTSRILVHESLRDTFVKKLTARVERVKVRDPLDPEAEMGAITTRELMDRCLRYTDLGTQQGARLTTGGRRLPEVHKDGMFFAPTVFSDVTPAMKIAQDEIFGPIISVLGWKNYDDMLATANGLPLGLTAVILTNDISVALRTVEAVEAGYVEVNGRVSFALGSPFGGYKLSGVGREGSMEELVSYTRIKSVNVKLPSADASAHLRRSFDL